MWVHENCGGRITSLLAANYGAYWGCDRCGKELNSPDVDAIKIPNETARLAYVSQIERDRFEKMICRRMVEDYYPQFGTSE